MQKFLRTVSAVAMLFAASAALPMHAKAEAWDIAKADGAIRELEDDVLWRAAALLGLDDSVAADVRREAVGDATGGP